MGGGLSPCEAHVERRAGGVLQRLSPCSWLAGSCWGKSRESCFPGRESQPRRVGGLVTWMGGKGDHPLAPPSGTCGVRGLSSIRLQLVTGLCPPCPLGLQGGSPAARIWGP